VADRDEPATGLRGIDFAIALVLIDVRVNRLDVVTGVRRVREILEIRPTTTTMGS
jgi:hypothetical protein